ncbi:ABC transporter ATP-binding protein [Acidisphaera sp. L21]|uniref:ABC transporter ATP-binding protein n=1 Tax=Acidisphaera sp. L21 TaxID=1641851 RepID=UPI00131A6391|nr:ABC transporter ATP-binding protein [Acidisphaera sp. L21]
MPLDVRAIPGAWLAYPRLAYRRSASARVAGHPGVKTLIKAEGLCVDFPIYHGGGRSLKKAVFAAASGRLGEDQQHRVVVQALRDISFTLRPGDRLGLVGGNGAGKTTLLRTLAGIYEPIIGKLQVDGVIGSLLDVNAGMNPELSGRENIMLRGLYNQMSRAQIAAMVDDVSDFAELGEFMELPVRLYSSGMGIRLAFGMATAIRPQILLMDEWFLAGDAAFLDKARARMESLVKAAEILVLSSHIESIVLEWATRVIWLDSGRIRADGVPQEVLHSYLGTGPVEVVAVEPS